MKLVTYNTDLSRTEIPTEGMVCLEVHIGDVKYLLSEKEGQLRVTVGHQLVFKPAGANSASLAVQI